MVRGYGVGLLVLAVMAAACERRERAEAESPPVVTLTIETPEPLDWGGSGTLRITLVNEGDVMAEGGIVEVHVPDWLEFGTVEPPGTAVTVVSGDTETRLIYQMTDSLPPGERRTVIQQLRVLFPAPAAPLPTEPNDTVETVQLAPANQLVRARLLTPAGEPAGAEVQATLHFVGASGRVQPAPVPGAAPGPAPGTMPGTSPQRDTIPADTASRDTSAARPPSR